jgi:hypothetical protein
MRTIEAVVPIDIGRVESRHLIPHAGGVAAVVEVRAVVEPNPVERVHGLERHVVAHLLTTQRPQFLQQVRGGDDGGAGIEGEAVLLPYVGAAANFVQLLQDRHAVALGTQAHGRGQATKAAADHDGMGSVVFRAQ